MAGIPPLVTENPVAAVLSVGFVLALLTTVGVALAGGRARLVIRLAALSVVLAVFAGGFWVNVVGERLDR